jgi:hypothetical protein
MFFCSSVLFLLRTGDIADSITIHSTPNMAVYFLTLDVFNFRETKKVAKSHSLCFQTMTDGIPDEGFLGYSAMRNQEMNRFDFDSETDDSTSRSGRGGPRLDEHGESKAGNNSAGEKLRSRAFILGGQVS